MIASAMIVTPAPGTIASTVEVATRSEGARWIWSKVSVTR